MSSEHDQATSIANYETACLQRAAAEKGDHWAVAIRVLPYREGNGWVVQFGDVKGYGDTPEQAIVNFDSAMGQRGGTSGNKP